jgi:hypothetical protein
MVTDRPEMVPYPEACPEEKYFSLTKTKDVAKCEKRSSFSYFAPGHYGHEVSWFLYLRPFPRTTFLHIILR